MIPGLIDITPGPNILDLGPLHVGWYGLGYILGLAALVFVSQRQAIRYRIDPNHVMSALILTVILAVIGGRLYHVIDQWGCAPAVFDASGTVIRAAQLCYSQNLSAIVLPPYAGLGLYGGVAGAILGIFIYARRKGLSLWLALDVVAPGALFAQGIARWGNFFNQELYGPPTSAPWGIAIDCAHRVAAYPCSQFGPATGFEPLFFDESALDIAGGLFALWLVRRVPNRLRTGDIASFWTIWYGSVRFALETFRTSYDWTLGGIPAAQLIGIGLVVFGVVTIAWRHRGPRPAAPEPEPDPHPEPAEAVTSTEMAAQS